MLLDVLTVMAANPVIERLRQELLQGKTPKQIRRELKNNPEARKKLVDKAKMLVTSSPELQRNPGLKKKILNRVGKLREHLQKVGRKDTRIKRNLCYGPHERNTMDVYRADTTGPAPCIIFFHGGGWMHGDKTLPEDKTASQRDFLKQCHRQGITVISCNYRFLNQAPLPAPMYDGARAVQFVRYHADELGVDPNRISLAGSSAGSGIAMWVGTHDDLADPNSPDPVARQSTRVSSVITNNAQNTYDPKDWARLFGQDQSNPQFMNMLCTNYGLTPDEVNSPWAYGLYEETSPLSHLSSDDPPIYSFYSTSRNTMDTHCARFGELLSSTADERGANVSFSSVDTRAGQREIGIYDFVRTNILGGSPSNWDSANAMNEVLQGRVPGLSNDDRADRIGNSNPHRDIDTSALQLGRKQELDAGKVITNGYFEARMSGWSAPAQGADKSHPLAGWERQGKYSHHTQPGSFWNWRIGQNYDAFKVLAAPRAIATREEARVGAAAAVNNGKVHTYRVEWKKGHVSFYFDGQLLKEWRFDRFAIRYFTIGKDDQYPTTNPAPRIFDVKIVNRDL